MLFFLAALLYSNASFAQWTSKDAGNKRSDFPSSWWQAGISYVRDIYPVGDWERRGYVGIGTDAPKAKLHIKGYNEAGDNSFQDQRDPVLLLEPATWGSGRFGKIKFGDVGDDNHYIKSGHTIGMEIKDVDGIKFTANSSSFFSFTGGNVGIGTTSPTARLEIAGNFKTVESGVTAVIGVYNGTLNGNNKGTYLNTTSNHPLYFSTYNNYAQMTLATTGNVGIGTTNPGSYKLAVEGTIGAREVEVKTGSWADFVFDNEYKLKSLKEVEHYIATHKHLPDVPSEATVKKDGINVAKMDAVLLQKIEELTLYLIEQNKQIDSLKKEIETLKSNKP